MEKRMTISINNTNIPAGGGLNNSSNSVDGDASQRLTAFMAGRGGNSINTGSGDDETYVGDNTQESGDEDSQNINTGSGDDKVVINGPLRGSTNINTGSGDDVVIINGENSSPSPEPEEPVAANEHGRIWNDPMFLGGDGGRYDIQGEVGKNYNLLADSGLEFRGQFDSFGEGTCVGKTGLSISGVSKYGLESTSVITFGKDGSAQINAEPMVEGETYNLADGGTAKLENGTLSVTTAEGYTINQTAHGSGDWARIDIDVTTGENGVDNGRLPGGLLGQSFDADDAARNGKTGYGAQGEGAIDGNVQDYEVSSLEYQCNPGVVIDDPIFDGPSIPATPLADGPININTGSGDDVVIINGGNSSQEPEAPVAANEQGRIWGDPHFVGGDGGKYDVQGEAGKTYDLLSDSGLDLRGQFDGWADGITVVGETGLTVGEGLKSDNINFRKDGSARLNGALMEEGKTYELADGGTAKLENGTLSVTTAEGYTIDQTAQGSGDRAYINVDVSTGDKGVDNGQMPGGLLGQTFDADDVARNGSGAQGEGAIDGDVSDYERSALDPINDNRGTSETTGSETDSEFKQMIEKMQELLEQLMGMLEQLSNGNATQQAASALETHTNTGSGDDEVKITAGGNHTVELGSGDDQISVDLKDGETGSVIDISGGSGDDTATLSGSESDYTVSHADGYTIYTDADGNTIKVADDVETVKFEEPVYIPTLGDDQIASSESEAA
jgi:hypothetical protein